MVFRFSIKYVFIRISCSLILRYIFYYIEIVNMCLNKDLEYLLKNYYSEEGKEKY